ncbi:zf-HC2 domain-containing protein [Streptomyces sp. PKU-EA00015]|uniref:zf-HC2 domain-containing protein n=1 Tax=Streptomyces sp. PKU-EA00015 TaxID=2748326 RepID=UPI00159F858C|nr:zf-HC2 domain-containing protein [Streptomyces sp. PKU-EA00015]NWF24979.1 zf-HC2 domain-containing protein [Streptomyces sp. PKU-EA00015]
MNAAVWHVTDELASRYASGAIPEPDAWSLEKHVESCTPCASRVSAAVRAGTAGPLLAELRTALVATAAAEPVRRPLTARLPGRATRTKPYAEGAHPQGGSPEPYAGRGPRTWARGLVPWPRAGGRVARARAAVRFVRAVGPGLHRAWVVALLLVGAGALGLGYGAGFEGARPLLLLVAPLVPLAGVGLSYGRHADPLYEIAVSTPSGGLRLLLTRTAAVLTAGVPLLTAIGALLPPGAGGPGAVAWLLPGLALTLAALALGTYVGCRTAATALAAGWLAVVVAPVLAAMPPEIADRLAHVVGGPATQSAWGGAALLCAALLALRRSSFDHLEKM